MPEITSTTETTFKFSPQLILNSLGEDVIEEDSIAIAEQIKNAIDAKAKRILIDLSKIDEDIIVISDDGEGMSELDIKSTWFLLATDFKSNDDNKLGGKGVGRFSLFRLANCIQISSISNKVKSSFILNREELEESQNLSLKSIPIVLQETNEKNGTTITLTNLNKIDLHEIEIGLENLLFNQSQLDLIIKYPDSFPCKNFVKPTRVLDYIPLQASIEINDSVINNYNFQAIYNGAKIYTNVNKSILQSKINSITEAKKIGNIKIFISNFYFHNQNSNLSSDDEAYLKEHFLSAYQGISIYRNNLKIYGHGENDWLKLAEKRLKRPGKIFDNKLSYGYIILPLNSVNLLKEKTNREGFIKNDFYRYFIKLMETIIEYIGSDREKAIKKINFNPIDRHSLQNIFHPYKKTIFSKNDTNEQPVNEDHKNNNNKQPVDEDHKNNNRQPVDEDHKNNNRQPVDEDHKNNNRQPVNEDHKNNNRQPVDETHKNNNKQPVDEDHKNNNNKQPIDITEKKDNTMQLLKMHYKKSKQGIGSFDADIFKNIQSEKVKELLHEIVTIETESFPLATAFLYRSLTEIMMDEFLIKHLNQYQTYFKDYVISPDGLVKLNPPNSNGRLKDISIKAKITCFRNLLKIELDLDNRSLKYLDDLSILIDEINLAMHWPNKTVAIDRLRTIWMNCKPFNEFICKYI